MDGGPLDDIPEESPVRGRSFSLSPKHQTLANNVTEVTAVKNMPLPCTSSSIISPSREAEVSMDESNSSPSLKMQPNRLHLQLDFSQGSSSRKSSKVLSALFTHISDPYSCGEEIEPAQMFTTSPTSPSFKLKEMMDDIDVSQDDESKEEDFLKRQSKPSIRRCRSLEMRKHLIDLSNTPVNAYKKNVTKRPPESLNQEKSVKRCKDFTTIVPKMGAIGTKPILSSLSISGAFVQDENTIHERIKTAVDALESPDLIADGTREYCLPVITGKHSDLKNIDHQTMADLLNRKFEGSFDKLTIIDCRYPYEYSGGHIKDAVNIFTEEEMVEFLNLEMKEVTMTSHRHILVFHCEFSSQRGPSLLRHLRKCDRQMNVLHYPQLTFPEVYCLYGGYKDFFLNHPELCEPSAYIPMIDEKYAEDLRHFRAKAKSWAAGEKKIADMAS
ncbi:M-phase inducer phosphatase-like [Physella acuta]|uniref:M-phase inducer phosphatase-like n=1 Tax=Physella acuta TaxID=109671 RepID=UPI0027DD109F|nr:M-phase inducer phosphatase-like [Physella acuta]